MQKPNEFYKLNQKNNKGLAILYNILIIFMRINFILEINDN